MVGALDAQVKRTSPGSGAQAAMVSTSGQVSVVSAVEPRWGVRRQTARRVSAACSSHAEQTQMKAGAGEYDDEDIESVAAEAYDDWPAVLGAGADRCARSEAGCTKGGDTEAQHSDSVQSTVLPTHCTTCHVVYALN